MSKLTRGRISDKEREMFLNMEKKKKKKMQKRINKGVMSDKEYQIFLRMGNVQ